MISVVKNRRNRQFFILLWVFIAGLLLMGVAGFVSRTAASQENYEEVQLTYAVLLPIIIQTPDRTENCTIISDGVSMTECNALLEIYAAADGPNWHYGALQRYGVTVWTRNTEPCTWYGVLCTQDAQVAAIILKRANAEDVVSDDTPHHLPAAIGQFSYLDLLDLSENRFATLPPEIGRLLPLRYLDVSENQLTMLPTEIKALTSLVHLHLNDNQLTALPEGLADFSNLTHLDLSSNPNLVGELPRELMDTEIKLLYFEGTQLCEPADDAFQTWLASIPEVSRTQILCE